MTVQTLAGILGIQDSERTYVETVGQVPVFAAIQEYVAMVNEDLARVTSLFIERTTEDHKFRYYLPADGELQRKSALGRPGESKVGGSWDVALPLEGFGDALGTSQRDLAYMTIADYQRALDGITLRAGNTMRKEILRTLLDNVNYTFPDERKGDLGVKALANQDGTLFPALAGGTTAAQANHYAESGYVVSSIDDTHNPIKTVSRALRSRFGANGNKRRRVVLIAENMQDYVEALTDFEEVNDANLQKGANSDQVLNIPVSIPGEIIGYCNEAYVSVWPWMPSNYSIGIDLQAPKPLQMRVDPAYTNLPRGLVLTTTDEHNYPLTKSEWEWWFGLAVVNRLNGYILEVANGGTYTVPSGYSH
jgi:hypothetical protein